MLDDQKEPESNEVLKESDSPVEPVVEVPKITLYHKLFPKGRKSNLMRNIMLSAIALSFVAMVSTFFIYRIDGLFLPSTLKGLVLDHNNEPLAGVIVYLDGKEMTKTNSEGNFTITKGYGEYKFRFVIDKFEPLETKINILRGANDAKINMQPNAIGDIVIKITAASNEVLNTDNMNISFDDKVVTLNDKGEFALDRYPVGIYKFKLISPYYYDVESDIDLKAGDNNNELKLTRAWDLAIDTKNWLTKEKVSSVKIVCDGTEKITDADGSVVFKDLIKFNSLKLKITKDNYLPQELDLKVDSVDPNSGINVWLVKSGRSVYLSNRTGSRNLYAANFDGSDEIMLSDNQGDVLDYEYSTDGKQIYFLSNRDKLRDAKTGNVIYLPYSISINGGAMTKIAKTNYSDYGSIGVYNFKAQKRAFLTSDSDESNQVTSSIFFGSIDGSSSNLLLEKKAYINRILISNDGKTIFFSIYEQDGGAGNGVYALDTNTKEVKKVYATDFAVSNINGFSANGEYLLLSLFDPANGGADDLWILGMNGTAKRLTNNSSEERWAKFIDNSHVIYVSDRDQAQNIYILDVNTQTETALTATEGTFIDNIIQNPNGYIEYYQNGTLIITDPGFPGFSTTVSNSVIRWL
jgi:Tol biopolymer transport system component